MRYQYEALDQTGQEISGDTEAPSKQEALAKIRKMGYFPTRIQEDGYSPTRKRKKRNSQVASVLWLLAIFVFFLVIPLVYWWNHDHLTQVQLIKEIWWTLAIGMSITGVGIAVACRWN